MKVQTKKANAPKRAASVMLAAALVCSMFPGAYAFAATDGDATYTVSEESQNQISIQAPVAVTFGGSEGYDVASPSESISATGYNFANTSTSDVYIKHIKCEDLGAVSSGIIQSTSSTTIDAQRIFSLSMNGNEVSFGVGDTVNELTSSDLRDSFTIQAGTSMSATFRLNLYNTSQVPEIAATVNAEKADNAANFQKLAKVTYTFGLIDSTFIFYDLTPDTTPDADCTYKDSEGNVKTGVNGSTCWKGAIYGIKEMKAIADDISKNNANSIYWPQFTGYIASDAAALSTARASDKTVIPSDDDRGYKCTTMWDIQYDVRIIGLNHDIKSSDHTTKAGITFQFVNYFSTKLRMNTPAWSAGGWEKTWIRTNMNPDPENGNDFSYKLYESASDFESNDYTEGTYENIDSNSVWGVVPKTLQDNITAVDKTTNAVWCNASGEGTTVTTSDKLFICSYAELSVQGDESHTGVKSGWDTTYPFLCNKEGQQYSFWTQAGASGTGTCNVLFKGPQSSPSSSDDSWWERSCRPLDSFRFMQVSSACDSSSGSGAAAPHGVVPCFCF